MQLQILEDDVAAMYRYINSSPSAKMPENNAIAYALRRVVRPGLPVSVTFQNGRPVAKLGSWECKLEREICSWLAEILMGLKFRTISITIQIPESLVLTSIHQSTRRRLDLLPQSMTQMEENRNTLGARIPLTGLGGSREQITELPGVTEEECNFNNYRGKL